MALDPVLTARTVPKAEQKAYLYAKLTTARGTPLLPGTVALFRDATFVGNGQLHCSRRARSMSSASASTIMIRVRHAVVDDKRGETGLISTSKTDVRNYRITVKNLHERRRSSCACSIRSRWRRMTRSRSSCRAARRRRGAMSRTSAA